MRIDFNSVKPVYIQIAEAIEDDIISGGLAEGGAAYSQLAIAKGLNVNPATAAKGINVLVSSGILVKQRGSSMAVAYGAADRLLRERRERGFKRLVGSLVDEAVKLKITEGEVIGAVREYYKGLEVKDE